VGSLKRVLWRRAGAGQGQQGAATDRQCGGCEAAAIDMAVMASCLAGAASSAYLFVFIYLFIYLYILFSVCLLFSTVFIK
jgi:hypothetical protein